MRVLIIRDLIGCGFHAGDDVKEIFLASDQKERSWKRWVGRVKGAAQSEMIPVEVDKVTIAGEAKRIRLVKKVVPQERLMDEVRELARKLLKGVPLAQQAIKYCVYRGR